jgi:hypothetical protein
MNRTLTIMLVTALGLIAAQVAWATIPGGNGHIVGCYKTSGGALRVVNAPTDCASATEKSLVWSQAAATFNVDVSPTTSTTTQTQLVKQFGITLSYRCHAYADDVEQDTTLFINPGSTGITNGTYTHELSDDGAGGQVRPAQLGFVGAGSLFENDPFYQEGFPPSGWLRDEGTLLIKTVGGLATLTFHIVNNWDTHRCQYMGVLRAA